MTSWGQRRAKQGKGPQSKPCPPSTGPQRGCRIWVGVGLKQPINSAPGHPRLALDRAAFAGEEKATRALFCITGCIGPV